MVLTLYVKILSIRYNHRKEDRSKHNRTGFIWPRLRLFIKGREFFDELNVLLASYNGLWSMDLLLGALSVATNIMTLRHTCCLLNSSTVAEQKIKTTEY